ncbi:hypothetical protein [Meiothermus granaticius]|uniref:Uncharacterized protein n=1 Tax=Meiothermus granaticius NBRC 107808 TaxID=1227551 RepID=A0A399F3R4_9DEIN|nr:hypothetical protein [Meiothermus granaticius]RIH90690.1 hypothetical protein Mgrana_03202 [Meiothermus granaticius NBRC 107808]GEM88472.1 hypothetical protein MGR01S_30970 [Meiothermus granaticius NBRC 107808]
MRRLPWDGVIPDLTPEQVEAADDRDRAEGREMVRVLPEAERLLHHLTQRGYALVLLRLKHGYLAMARLRESRHIVASSLENGSVLEALRELAMELGERL